MSNTIINGGASPYPKHVGPAAICSFSDGAQDAPLKSLKFYVEPQQDLHGYSYPWPAGSTKNQMPGFDSGLWGTANTSGWTIGGYSSTPVTFPVSLSASQYQGVPAIKFKLKPSTTYYITGISPMYWCGSFYDSSNTKLGSFPSATHGGTFTTPANTDYAIFALSNYQAAARTLSTSMQIQVEEGETETSYIPYSNICPISGWTQVDGWQSGGNLFNYDAWKTVGVTRCTAVFENNGVTLTATGTDAFTNYLTADFPADARIPVKVGEPITLSWDTPDTTVAANVYIFPNGGSTGNVHSAAATKKLTYTPTAGITYVTFRLGVTTNGNTVHYKNLMVNFGTAAAAYTPFVSKTPITISLGQTVYGGTVDAIAGKCYARPYYASYSGQALVGPWISSHDKYVAGGTPTTGAQVVDMGGTETTLSLTPVSVNSLLGQNNIWANTGDTELDYYPAAASVVAVLNKSSKVYTSIPLGKIRYDTYQTTPNQALDLDSYRAETGVLIRNVLSHTATKIEFNTPSMTNAQWEEVWNIIKAGFNNSTERKLKLKYYDQMSATYKTGWFYVPDVQFTIRNIDEAAGIINYDEVRVAFIEY